MVRVFYGSRINATLGGIMFYSGIAEFENDEAGIKFANMFYRKYEVVKVDKPAEEVKAKKEQIEEVAEEKPKKAPAKKKVKKV